MEEMLKIWPLWSLLLAPSKLCFCPKKKKVPKVLISRTLTLFRRAEEHCGSGRLQFASLHFYKSILKHWLKTASPASSHGEYIGLMQRSFSLLLSFYFYFLYPSSFCIQPRHRLLELAVSSWQRIARSRWGEVGETFSCYELFNSGSLADTSNINF